MGDTILRVDDIQKFYGNKGNLTKAIDHISFSPFVVMLSQEIQIIWKIIEGF